MKHTVHCFSLQDKGTGSRRVVIADEPERWTNTINTPQPQGTVVIIEFSVYKVLFYSTAPVILQIALWINETRYHYPQFLDKKIKAQSDSTIEEGQRGKRGTIFKSLSNFSDFRGESMAKTPNTN